MVLVPPNAGNIFITHVLKSRFFCVFGANDVIHNTYVQYITIYFLYISLNLAHRAVNYWFNTKLTSKVHQRYTLVMCNAIIVTTDDFVISSYHVDDQKVNKNQTNVVSKNENATYEWCGKNSEITRSIWL